MRAGWQYGGYKQRGVWPAVGPDLGLMRGRGLVVLVAYLLRGPARLHSVEEHATREDKAEKLAIKGGKGCFEEDQRCQGWRETGVS